MSHTAALGDMLRHYPEYTDQLISRTVHHPADANTHYHCQQICITADENSPQQIHILLYLNVLKTSVQLFYKIILPLKKLYVWLIFSRKQRDEQICVLTFTAYFLFVFSH